MLKIFFGDMSDAVYNTASYFKYDYEDDWIFCILAYRAAEKICLEKKTVYSWRVHNQSESHNRVVKDRYLTHFYENYCEMRKFFLDAVNSTQIGQTDLRRYQCELQKMALLWSLSNETGRGIAGRTEKESIAVMRYVVQEEKRNGIGSRKHLWQCNGPRNGPLAKISMLKSLEIKGFIGGNRENEIRNRGTAKRRKKYPVQFTDKSRC